MKKLKTGDTVHSDKVYLRVYPSGDKHILQIKKTHIRRATDGFETYELIGFVFPDLGTR